MFLKIASIIFALAALGGLTLAMMHIWRRGAPIALALLHGLVAATGLGVLVLAMVKAQLGGLVAVSVVLFALAAMGGIALFSIHLRARPLPVELIVLHGLMAIVAFAVLLASLFLA